MSARGFASRAASRGRVLGVLLTGLLAGCGHTPNTDFFTLAAVRADGPAEHFVGAPVQVRAVHIPAVLDRTEIVTASSRQRLDIHQFQQWGSPLADMIRRILTEDLAARLPAGMVRPADAPAEPQGRGVVIDVQEFEPGPGEEVVLDASWTVLDSGQPPTLQRQQRLEQATGGGTDAQVRAMSALLGRLADAIAASLRASG